MNSETKQCQNCKNQFTIESEDFDFYKKMDVPAPTFCPECRLQRRLSFRNERNLYKRKCDAPGHEEMLISMYSPESPAKVYDHTYWWSDKWDPMEFGSVYDPSRPFLEQWKELLYKVPTPALINIDGVESDYCNFTYQSKNCYLNFASDMNEDSSYLYHSIKNKNSSDMIGSSKNEGCYELIDSEGCYNSDHLILSDTCIDSKYCYDCRNCQYCIGCVGLRNSKYCILNRKLSEEEYKNEVNTLHLNTKTGNENFKEKFSSLVLKYPKKFSNSRHIVNATGDYLKEVKNSKDCFDIEGPLEDSRFVIYGVTDMRDLYDAYAVGVNMEKSYDVMDAGSNMHDAAFSGNVWDSYSIRYCYFLRNCSNCFGCIGLRNKQYCILNKQYTKEDYEHKVGEIIAQMNEHPYKDSAGREYKYGEFFPIEFSPFAYNEAAVQEYFPLTKEETIKKGYTWRDREERDYKVTIKSENIPDDINNISDSITNDIIACAHGGNCNDQCTIAFKIIPQEFQLYKKNGIPLPNLCPNCRHYARLKQRNPLKLWKRTCQCAGIKSENGIYTNTGKHQHEGACQNEFETSYSPDRKEIVYCEQCYQAEIV
ncbi:MAG: hypothetical protein AB1333_01655 [Patescibacteria group bacterium]